MVGQKWSKTFFLLIIHIETVLGNDKTNSVAKVALGNRTILCSFEGNKDHDGTANVRNYEVFISSPWMRKKGCYYNISDSHRKKQEQLDHNSPGRCSLFCESNEYFGVQDKTCVCLETIGSKSRTEQQTCDKPCPDNDSKTTCGSTASIWYFDVYQHRIEFNRDPLDRYNVDKNCMVATALDDIKVKYKAVSCPEQLTGICFLDVKGTQTVVNKLKSKDEMGTSQSCFIFGDQQRKHTDKLPKTKFVWTTFKRSKILIWKNEDRKYEILHNSECQLETLHNWSIVTMSLKSAGKTYTLITLRCSMKLPSDCTVLYVKDMEKPKHAKKGAHDLNSPLSTASDYTSSGLQTSTKEKSTYTTMTTEFESNGLSTNVESTSTYDFNTTETSFSSENYGFALQIGIAISVSCLVILTATVACCMYRPKRGTYTFPISRSEENIDMATEGPQQHTRSTAVLAESYSDPIDKASTSNEIEGPRFCGTESCQSTTCQKTETGEYQHLDFTLRSETTPRFTDNNEYDHCRANVISVFEQPWDTATSKVNKFFSQISKSVVQKGQNMRKSLIKRRASRSGSPKLKCRASDYCDAWKTQLNNQQFVFDSDEDNQSNISIDVAHSTVDSNKDESEFRRTDSAFPVLPYSERINVKSTHIYDEPDDRRMSLRERLLHMISIRPLKMPFGIELDLRGSRSKSKIYSLATPIDEIDESVA